MIRIVFVAAALFLPAFAEACTCFGYPITEKGVARALCDVPLVVVGDVERTNDIPGVGAGYQVTADKFYRGTSPTPMHAVYTSSAECSYNFNYKGKYLIFATEFRDTNYLIASSCGLTGLVENRELVIEILDKILDSDQDPCNERGIGRIEIILAAGLFLAIGGVAVFSWTRRRT